MPAKKVHDVTSIPVLKEWLEQHNSQCLWQHKQTNGFVEGWMVNGRVVIITTYTLSADRASWEIFTALDTIDILDSLKDVEKRIGL